MKESYAAPPKEGGSAVKEGGSAAKEAESEAWDAPGAYDEIASEWEEYRSKPNANLSFFLPQVNSSDSVLEAGCANGMNLPELAKKARIVIGLDSSAAMVKYALERIKGLDNVTAMRASVTEIPLPGCHFDKAFCLAVLHHMSTPESREKAFAELHRVLKPGGILVITVWNRHQKKFEKLEGPDALVNWRTKSGKIIKRYYHFFEEDELRKYAEKAGFVAREIFFDKHKHTGKHNISFQMKDAKNLCAVLEKRVPEAPEKPKKPKQSRQLFPAQATTKRKK